jgi:hypothetical protein
MIAFWGHFLTQAPHPSHSSSEMKRNPFDSFIALDGHAALHPATSGEQCLHLSIFSDFGFFGQVDKQAPQSVQTDSSKRSFMLPVEFPV